MKTVVSLFERPEDDTKGPVTIPAGTQVRADDSASRTPILFTTATSATIETGETSTSVMAYNYFLRKISVLESEVDAFSSDYLNIVRRHFLTS